MIKIHKDALIPSINMIFGDLNNECVVIEDNDPSTSHNIVEILKIKI